MPWRYRAFPANKARYDPLGPGGLSQLADNHESLLELLVREHQDVGGHNALEVARMVGAVTYSGGAWSRTDFQGDKATLETGHAPATGRVLLTPSSTFSNAASLVAIVNVRDAAAASKPHMVGFHRASSTEIGLYSWGLTDTLTTWGSYPMSGATPGSGSAVAAANRDMDVAFFGPSFASPSSLAALPGRWARGDALGNEATTRLNRLVELSALTHIAVIVGHNADGTHATPEVARAFAPISLSGTTYTLLDATRGVASISRTSAGVVRVTLSDTFTGTADMHCFAHATTGGALQIVHCVPASTTAVDCYLYQYLDPDHASAPNTWTRNDFAFSFAAYGDL